MDVRKIAANYIYLPGFSLVNNGYVILAEQGIHSVVDTGGKITEIAGLEFYGGLIVPEYACSYKDEFRAGLKLLPILDRLYALQGTAYRRVAIIEGADLRELTWRTGTGIRKL